MNSIKKLIGVASEKLNLNDVKLSDTIISPDDFLQVYDRVTFEDTAVISGRVDSTAQGLDLLSAATIPLNGVLLKNETGPIRADADSLMTLSQNGIALFDQINPTAIVTDAGLTVKQALELGNARLDLSDHHIVTGETADLLQAVELLDFQGLDISGLEIERGDVLLSTSIHNVNALKSAEVVFDSSGTEKLFTIDEEILGPIQA